MMKGVYSMNVEYELEATGEQGTEDRVRIEADQLGIDTLSDISTIEFDQDVESGYIGHVDVRVIKDDGTEDALVFEYAKVDPNDCDDSEDYPTGEVDTFGDKGIIDDNAYAWLSSGPAGPCGDASFKHYSLADWKLGEEGIDGSSTVVAIEFEVDNWIEDSKDTIGNIVLNSGSEQREITIEPGRDNIINTKVVFDFVATGDYEITTAAKAVQMD
jgi:hypothetical protein